MDWSLAVQRAVDRAIRNHPTWPARTGVHRLQETGVHLAVVREPYLSLILAGTKSVESRFSKHDRPPFERVLAGDVLLLKAPAGPIKGIAHVHHTWYFRRAYHWSDIRERFGKQMCATDDAFWELRAEKNYASLLQLDHVLRLDIACAKRDRRAWVILNEPRLWS